MRSPTKVTWPTAPQWMTQSLTKPMLKALRLRRCSTCRLVKDAANAFYPGHAECRGCRKAYKKSDRGRRDAQKYDSSPKRKRSKDKYYKTPKGQRSRANTRSMRAAREKLAGPQPSAEQVRQLWALFLGCAYCQGPVAPFHLFPWNLEHVIPLKTLDSQPGLPLNDIANRLPCCGGCGRSKGTKLLYWGWWPTNAHPMLEVLHPPPPGLPAKRAAA